VLVLFPYYRLGGVDVSMEELEDLVEKRRFAAESTQTDMSIIRALRADIRLLDKKYKSTEENMSTIEARLQEVLRQTSEVQIPDPPPEPKPIPEPIPEPVPVPEPPRNVGSGQEFSILGFATQKKDFVILVDMSGSMRAHTQKVSNALKEIVSQMDDTNRFVIIGYRGGPTFESFPRSGTMERASPNMIAGAVQYVDSLPRRFGGGTPTQTALLRAMNLRPRAIILISDGAPDDGAPGSIIRNITRRNRGASEIHTVAIGDYTRDKNLTLFLQELATNNNGDFVGRVR
jgi:hypothetical protein